MMVVVVVVVVVIVDVFVCCLQRLFLHNRRHDIRQTSLVQASSLSSFVHRDPYLASSTIHLALLSPDSDIETLNSSASNDHNHLELINKKIERTHADF